MSSTVALTAGPDPSERVRRAVSLLGGMERFVSPGQTVFVKPNLVFAEPPPKTTDLRVVACLVRMAKEAGAARVLVGDSPSSAERKYQGLQASNAFEKTGMKAAVEEAGGEVVLLDQTRVVEVEIPGAALYRKARVYSAFLEPDVVISVPVMKTHYLTDVTLGVKCLYGFVAQEHRKVLHRDDQHQKLADILKLRKPDLTVIDAGLAMEGLGPNAGSPVRLDATLAGADAVACDAVGTTLMGFDPMMVDHLRIAWWEGLGEAQMEAIRVVGNELSSVKKSFKLVDLRLGGCFEGVTVIEGGVCRECIGRARWVLERCRDRGLLSKERPLTLVLGVTPYIPAELGSSGNAMVIGDCAIDEYRRRVSETPKNVLLAGGCPSDTSPRVAPPWLEEVILGKR